MTKTEISNDSNSKRHNWHCMCGGRNSGIFWGIFMIVVGLFWFGKKANWFSSEVIMMFWPLVFVVIGIWIIAATATRKSKP